MMASLSDEGRESRGRGPRDRRGRDRRVVDAESRWLGADDRRRPGSLRLSRVADRNTSHRPAGGLSFRPSGTCAFPRGDPAPTSGDDDHPKHVKWEANRPPSEHKSTSALTAVLLSGVRASGEISVHVLVHVPRSSPTAPIRARGALKGTTVPYHPSSATAPSGRRARSGAFGTIPL
jgi:hypothetical protein